MLEDNTQDGSATQKEQINPEEWIKEQHGTLLRYCSNKGLEISNVLDKKSAVLPPFVAVWLAESKSNKKLYWIISGDLPTDHIPSEIAKSPREALRHFSLNGQLKAENIVQALTSGTYNPDDHERQKQFAELLVDRAHSIYDLFVDEKMWQ